MHIYNNLDEDVKKAFQKDFMILISLAVINLYCIIVLSLSNSMGYFPVSTLEILILNVLFSTPPFSGLLNNIRYNKISNSQRPGDPGYIICFTLYFIMSMTILAFYYLDKNKTFSYLEFIPILLYIVIYSMIVLFCITKGVIECCSSSINFIKETKEAVGDREHLLKNKKLPEEIIIQ